MRQLGDLRRELSSTRMPTRKRLQKVCGGSVLGLTSTQSCGMRLLLSIRPVDKQKQEMLHIHLIPKDQCFNWDTD